MPRDGEKVILESGEEDSPAVFKIAHMNEHNPEPSYPIKKRTSGNIWVADYRIGKDCPGGYLIGKRYDTTRGISDVLVLTEGRLMYDGLYELALKEAQEYAESRGLELEDQTNFNPMSPP